jgi:hypothetical protein
MRIRMSGGMVRAVNGDDHCSVNVAIVVAVRVWLETVRALAVQVVIKTKSAETRKF